MSRSVHTRPLRIRAASRVREPFAGRGHRDLRLARAERRELKALGLRAADVFAHVDRTAALPRVVVHTPRPGHVHAVDKVDVEALLLQLGERFFYGLRTIELALAPARPSGLRLGRLVVPAMIRIFDVPTPPWTLTSPLADRDAERLARAGAILELDDRGALVVSWPGETLRRFVLLDVLLHELGHHVLQHHTGKRSAKIARTRDHEAAAELVAERARRQLERSS